MQRPGRNASVRPPTAEKQAASSLRRDRLAVLLALVTVVCLGLAFYLAEGQQFLTPGPMISAHGAIENCSTCHTKSGSGKLSWLHRFVAGDPLADSKACLTCHKIPDTAFNAHSASAEVLRRSTSRLTQVAAKTAAPRWARAQDFAFPTKNVVAGGLYCATCHREHRGVNFDLNKISNEQCHACHVVKFDSFDGQHPEFESYPFDRRTRIKFDHAGHVSKHFPEVARRYPERRIPRTCSNCHNSRKDRRIMGTVAFDQVCSACHLNQITGKERVSGSKGIAFLALPGLDLLTLKERNASIGEWPAASVAELTPFMKVMISRNERGRALIQTVNGLDLQDLSKASDSQIKAVTELVWEIKRLFYALIYGKASDVLGDLNIGRGAKLSAKLVADLTANIPRDVVISAHQQWLPNLSTEMANRQEGRGITRVRGWLKTRAEPRSAIDSEAASITRRRRFAQADQQTGTQTWQINPFGGRIKDESQAVQPGSPQPQAPPQPQAAQPQASQPQAAQPQASQPQAAQPQAPQPQAARPQGPPPGPNEQTDELLVLTEDERRALKLGIRPKGVAATAKPDSAAAANSPSRGDKGASANAPPAASADTAAAEPQQKVVPVISIESDVDPESWAEYGGWYRQDYTIFYRPTGHKDKFIYSWLVLTGFQAPKGDTSPAAAVFDFLTRKDAQGACTKCHSVDDIPGKGRIVNFSPLTIGSKQGRFTNFIHEPHFGVLENRGCLTCHNLEEGRPYLQSYQQGNPRSFVSNFSGVKKGLCQTCHTKGMARQDCLLCHKYHVNGVTTPIMETSVSKP